MARELKTDADIVLMLYIHLLDAKVWCINLICTKDYKNNFFPTKSYTIMFFFLFSLIVCKHIKLDFCFIFIIY